MVEFEYFGGDEDEGSGGDVGVPGEGGGESAPNESEEDDGSGGDAGVPESDGHSEPNQAEEDDGSGGDAA